MTTAILLSSIADSISQISVAGVVIKDKNEVVANWEQTPYVFYPKPEGWITNFSLDYVSVLEGADAPLNVSYTLTYRLLGVRIGDLSIFPTAYSDLVDKLILILNALIAVPGPYSGKIDMKIADVTIGPRPDPAGNNYFGADIALNIVEMQN